MIREYYYVKYIPRDGVSQMKKLLVLMAVVFAVSVFPAAAFAEVHHGEWAHHNKAWKDNHHRAWKENEREWKEHDREWKEHRYDRDWREEHAREWHEWYGWHRDNASELRLHINGDEFELDIDVRD